MWWNKKNEKTGSSINNTNMNNRVPTRLSGIHPNSNAFFFTAEFFVRLGEECAKINDNQFVCQFFIKPNGDFSCDFFDTDSAKAMFPAIANDIQAHFKGTDKQITHPMYTLSKICEIMQDDGPSAHVDSMDYTDGKSIIVRWN